VSATENYQQRRVHFAYHEAGHALVGHVIGRVIEEVSIAMRDDGFGGYCCFNPFIEDANDHPEWHDNLGNPELITIYYAGMLASAYACAPYVSYDEDEGCVEYPQGSERDDLEQIHRLLTQIETNEQQRETITDACWMRAQQILSEYWPAVDALATAFLKRERLCGSAAHRLIWQTIGYPVYAASIRSCRPCLLRDQCQWEGNATAKPRQVSVLLHPLQVGSAPLRWRDWSRRQHRRACMGLLRHQRVEVTLPQTTPAEPHRSAGILSRAQRAHYRLSWGERLARNAYTSTTDRPAIKQIARPRKLRHFPRSVDNVRRL